MDATRPEEEIRAALGRVREILDSFQCDVTYVEEWGRRKLAFPIKKKIEGFYVVYYFRTPGESHPSEELERYGRITDILLRHLLVRVPKLKTEADARREQALRDAEQALREEQRAKAAAAAEAARQEAQAEQPPVHSMTEASPAPETAAQEAVPSEAPGAAIPEESLPEQAPAEEQPAEETPGEEKPAGEQ